MTTSAIYSLIKVAILIYFMFVAGSAMNSLKRIAKSLESKNN